MHGCSFIDVVELCMLRFKIWLSLDYSIIISSFLGLIDFICVVCVKGAYGDLIWCLLLMGACKGL